jgi:hypothetical protein
VPQDVNANQTPDESTADEGDEAAAAEAEPDPGTPPVPASRKPPGADKKPPYDAPPPAPATDSKGSNVQKVTKPTKASLSEKRYEVLARLATYAPAVMAKPKDASVWWGRDPGSPEVRDALKAVIVEAIEDGWTLGQIIDGVSAWPGWEMLARDS